LRLIARHPSHFAIIDKNSIGGGNAPRRNRTFNRMMDERVSEWKQFPDLQREWQGMDGDSPDTRSPDVFANAGSTLKKHPLRNSRHPA
jgi:hypothetical protein